jgi:hypothetical protein
MSGYSFPNNPVISAEQVSNKVDVEKCVPRPVLALTDQPAAQERQESWSDGEESPSMGPSKSEGHAQADSTDKTFEVLDRFDPTDKRTWRFGLQLTPPNRTKAA